MTQEETYDSQGGNVYKHGRGRTDQYVDAHGAHT